MRQMQSSTSVELARADVANDAAAMSEDVMAKVIEFYIPDLFPKRVNHIARTKPGKVLEFRSPGGRGLVMQFRDPASPDPDAKEGAIPMWTFCF